MKVIIAGSRYFADSKLMALGMEASGFDVTEVVSGGADGADLLGERWVWQRRIPVRSFPAYWARHGKAAGPIRNGQMVEYADALVAFPRADSKGTADMIRQAWKAGLRVHVMEEVP